MAVAPAAAAAEDSSKQCHHCGALVEDNTGCGCRCSGQSVNFVDQMTGLRVTEDDTSGSDKQGQEEIWRRGAGNGLYKSGEDTIGNITSLFTSCT